MMLTSITCKLKKWSSQFCFQATLQYFKKLMVPMSSSEADVGPGQISAMELFCENSSQLLTINCFHKKAPAYRIQNIPLVFITLFYIILSREPGKELVNLTAASYYFYYYFHELASSC